MKSLFGQTLLILLLGLVLSHGIGAWIYGSDREQAVRAVGGLAVAQRIANNTRLIEEAPPEWRPRIVAGLNDPSFRVTLSGAPPSLATDGEAGPIAEAIRDFLARQMPDGAEQRLRVSVAAGPGAGGGPPFAHRGPMHPGFRGARAWRGLRAEVALPDGGWLVFATVLPGDAPALSRQFVLSMAITGGVLLLVSVWAVRRLTAPLGRLAQAAERLGKDMGAEPLAEVGTIEMRQAAQAFNRMQERLKRLIENRTALLAAISHDLRTPLTLLRLRAETIDAGEERDRMLATIGEMDAMLGATLSFARDEAKAEPRRAADLAALVASLADDMADAGLPVSMAPAEPVTCACQTQALRRAVANLIDNAVKYGGAARLALAVGPAAVAITVDDDGPGIPEAEQARVLQPFYRLESSRSRDTGGIGLGLAITLSIVQAHGGTLTLANRPGGGLRATITVPR